jgi:predicted N-acyltransferase
MSAPLTARIHEGMNTIPRVEWDALAHHNNPFVSHAFLSLLEDSGSVGARAGWLPRIVTVHDGAGTIVAGAPLYLRTNSYGEYIFDWGFAEAAPRFSVGYYPKLACAIPFTPATGPRLLVRAGGDESAARAALLAGMNLVMREERCSSLHVLYCRDDEAAWLERAGMTRRSSMQFHWRNDGYRDFDDLLARFRHEDRKQVRRERRRVQEAGIDVEVCTARSINAALWPQIFALYTSTSDRKWGSPYLSPAFFEALPDALGDGAVVALAHKDGALVAMTLSFERGDHLYGRYWGTSVEVPGLHFELCYYALIERAIARGHVLVEAGAQGEHKLKRGFLPVLTHSAHAIVDAGFARAVERFITQERTAIGADIAEGAAHGPFKDGAAPPRPLVAGVLDL